MTRLPLPPGLRFDGSRDARGGARPINAGPCGGRDARSVARPSLRARILFQLRRRGVAQGFALALAGCGHLTASERYAIAVGVGAVGTALVTTTGTCVDESSAACQRLAWRSGFAVVGAGLTAGAGAYLAADARDGAQAPGGSPSAPVLPSVPGGSHGP